jgi:hypothetical protein
MDIPDRSQIQKCAGKYSSKITMQTEPETELLSLPATEPGLIRGQSGSPWVRAELIRSITGHDDAALRRLAAKGIIPQPSAGRYHLEGTLRGIFAEQKAKIQNASADSRFDRITFPSMENCEARTGIPKSFMVRAKEFGCDAFDSPPLVRLAPLVKWIFREGNERQDWALISEKFDALLKQQKYEIEAGELFDRDEVRQFISQFSAIYWNTLRRWRLELPRELEMRDRAFIKSTLDAKFSATIAAVDCHLSAMELKSPDNLPVNENYDAARPGRKATT